MMTPSEPASRPLHAGDRDDAGRVPSIPGPVADRDCNGARR